MEITLEIIGIGLITIIAILFILGAVVNFGIERITQNQSEIAKGVQALLDHEKDKNNQ